MVHYASMSASYHHRHVDPPDRKDVQRRLREDHPYVQSYDL